MKITSISYKKIFPGEISFTNETVGIEISLDADDNVFDVLDNAKATVEEWHRPKHPAGLAGELMSKAHIRYSEPIDKPYMDEVEVVRYVKPMDWVGSDAELNDAIINAVSIEELAKYRPDLPSKLKPVYLKKMKELTPKSI